MESISELRRICQGTRPSVFSDFLSQWYYRIAIYFTWMCLKLRMSANQVTVLSGAVSILGGILIASELPWLILLGALCFHLFAILDMSDGEVARYRNQGGVTGHYLDWFMHYVSSTVLIVGLFLASLPSLDSPWLIGLGVLAVLFPILDKSVMTAGWTVICWTRLRDLQKEQPGHCGEVGEEAAPAEGKPVRPRWQRRIIFLATAPMQDHWAPVVLVIMAFIGLVVDLMGWTFIDYRLWWLLYVAVLAPVIIYLRVRRMVLTDVLKDGYRRVMCSSRPIKFPDDDFL